MAMQVLLINDFSLVLECLLRIISIKQFSSLPILLSALLVAIFKQDAKDANGVTLENFDKFLSPDLINAFVQRRQLSHANQMVVLSLYGPHKELEDSLVSFIRHEGYLLSDAQYVVSTRCYCQLLMAES